MAETTTRWRIPTPELSDAANIPADLKAVADAVDDHAKIIIVNDLRDRPSSGRAGTYCFVQNDRTASDSGTTYLDIGTAWVMVGGVAAAQVNGAKIADGAVASRHINDALKPSRGASTSAETLRALGTSGGTAMPGDTRSIGFANTGARSEGLAHGSFRAIPTDPIDISGWSHRTVIFNHKIFDISSCYNTSSGEYTVPESGIFVFNATLIFLSAPTGVLGYFVDQDDNVMSWYVGGDEFGYCNMTEVLPLTRGNRIRLAVQAISARTSIGSDFSSFSAFMIGRT